MKDSRFLEPSGRIIYDWSPGKVTKFLLSIIALLVAFNIIERVIVYWLNAQGNSEVTSVYFNFDREANLPSLYSALALGFCSYLLATIATVKKKAKARYAKHWKALSFIFLFLAIDEATSIHELLMPVMKGVVDAEGFLYFPWIIPAFCLVIIFLLVFRKFILALPIKTKTLFIISGTIYILGALGMEMIGGYVADNAGYSVIYGIVSSIEELLEMFGIVIFTYALLSYLQSQIPKLSFSLSFQQPKAKKLRS